MNLKTIVKELRKQARRNGESYPLKLNWKGQDFEFTRKSQISKVAYNLQTLMEANRNA